MGARGLVLDLDALRLFPVEQVERILDAAGRNSQRRRKLPAYLMVYYLVALGLLVGVGAREVLRRLLERERERYGGTLASEAAITKARVRLGVQPLVRLFNEQVRPIATRAVRGAWFKGWRVVAIDGSTINVADTPSNVRVFGRPPGSRGKTVFAQMRWVGLGEIGTHVLFAVEMAGWRVSEYRLGMKLLKHLDGSMLCLADRGFYGFEMWDRAVQSGAQLLWRVQKQIPLPRLCKLADGSYLSEVRPRSTERKHVRAKKIQVRLIEFDVIVRNRRTEHYRLITNILDPKRATAMELARLYGKRWGIETIFDEIKDRVRGGAPLLRSKRPDLIKQDFYGLLLAHFGVRSLMLEAAREADVEPADLSFAHALSVIISRLPEMVSFSPSFQAALP
jgi:hypothetical protein